jgi:hypothetical protein
MDQITVDQAQVIAQQELSKFGPDNQFVIMPEETGEFPFGWVFKYLPQRYLDTRAPGDLVPGTGPLVVSRDGSALFLTTSVPPDVAVHVYLKQWRQTQSRSHT